MDGVGETAQPGNALFYFWTCDVPAQSEHTDWKWRTGVGGVGTGGAVVSSRAKWNVVVCCGSKKWSQLLHWEEWVLFVGVGWGVHSDGGVSVRKVVVLYV